MHTPLDALLPPGLAAVRDAITVASRTIGLYRVSDANALADAVGPEAFEQDERFPYWAELWPAGLALAGFLLRNGIGGGAAALELGCGMGLVGVAAALNGAEVLFTDFEAQALGFARANHALNLGTPGRTLEVDWRRPPPGLAAPLVLAADVLYEKRFLDPFLETLTRVLAPGGRAFVAEPGRQIALGTVERLDERGFARDLHLEELELNGRLHGVWIHELRAAA